MKKSDIKPTEIKASSGTIQSAKSVVASESPKKDLCCDDDHLILDGVESIEKSEGDGTPDIINTLVYYGLGEGKKPDPNRILFYERPDGSCIDVTGGTVLSNRPSVLDHLPSRAITTDERDIVSAIINGAMSDSDFASLSENGMIGDLPKRLWEKTQLLKSQTAGLAKAQELAKSEGADEEDTEEPESEADDQEEDEVDSQSSEKNDDNSESEPDSQPSENSSDDEMSEDLKAVKEDVGDDVFQEIMDLAMAKALNAVGGNDGTEGLEGKIRSIVHEVLEQMFGDEDPSQEQSEEEEPEVEEGAEDDQSN